MKVLGVIPARGGSKGITRKNLATVGGRPLVAWTIDQALAAQKLTSLVLSTDDPEIADVGREMGVEIPFLRPAELAADTTPTIDVLIHLCDYMRQQGRGYDAMCLLQPTSPERTGTMIDQCIDRWAQSSADSLVTVSPVPHQYNPQWVYWKDESDQLELSTGGVEPTKRRQNLPPAYIRDGRIYITRTSVLVDQRSLYGKTVLGFETKPGINIDTPEDLKQFRQRMEHSEDRDR